MNKIKIKILETDGAVNCKHDVLTCNHCASVISMREPKKFNAKRFIALAKKIEKDTKSPVSIHSQKDVNKVSYTCCNIEVSEPKGTEVMCRGCSEYCVTK